MKISLGYLRRIIRENLKDIPKATCRVCSGTGRISGEYCASCEGSGEEISYEADPQMQGVGRPTVPHTK